MVDNADPDDNDDGMPDDWEIERGIDPLADNSGDDGNGLSDLEEYENNTAPNNPDSDGDGLSDGDEIAAGEDPAVFSGPRIPVLVSPIGGNTAGLPVQLSVTHQVAADPALHRSTRWQIASDSGFSSPALDITSEGNLLLLSVPEQVLAGETVYFWRVRFAGTDGYPGEWSDAGAELLAALQLRGDTVLE